MSFYSERTVKATRKLHFCDGCNRAIDIGAPAVRWAGLTDGDFGAAIYHPDCRAAEIALNHDILGWLYLDDWCPLSDIDREAWPWLNDAFPAVAARMNIAASLTNVEADKASHAAQVVGEGSREEPND